MKNVIKIQFIFLISWLAVSLSLQLPYLYAQDEGIGSEAGNEDALYDPAADFEYGGAGYEAEQKVVYGDTGGTNDNAGMDSDKIASIDNFKWADFEQDEFADEPAPADIPDYELEDMLSANEDGLDANDSMAIDNNDIASYENSEWRDFEQDMPADEPPLTDTQDYELEDMFSMEAVPVDPAEFKEEMVIPSETSGVENTPIISEDPGSIPEEKVMLEFIIPENFPEKQPEEKTVYNLPVVEYISPEILEAATKEVGEEEVNAALSNRRASAGARFDNVTMGQFGDWSDIADFAQKGVMDGTVDLQARPIKEKVDSLQGKEKSDYLAAVTREVYGIIKPYDYSEINVDANGPLHVFYVQNMRDMPKDSEAFINRPTSSIVLDVPFIERQMETDKENISYVDSRLKTAGREFKGFGISNMPDEELFENKLESNLSHELGHYFANEALNKQYPEQSLERKTKDEEAAYWAELAHSRIAPYSLGTLNESRNYPGDAPEQYASAAGSLVPKALKELGYIPFIQDEVIKFREGELNRRLSAAEKIDLMKAVSFAQDSFFDKKYTLQQIDFIQKQDTETINKVAKNNYEENYGPLFSRDLIKVHPGPVEDYKRMQEFRESAQEAEQ